MNTMRWDDPENDGRGVMRATWMQSVDRPMDRDQWLREVFPEWGTFLNNQIRDAQVEQGQVNLWWFGGPSFVLKTRTGEVFLVDGYAGPSSYTEYQNCGVCRTSGATTINWMKLWPQVFDPWGFARLDAALSTHHHSDHCDVYTIKAALQTTDCPFVGPLSCVERFRNFKVPEDRIARVKPGDTLKYGATEIEVVPCFDTIATYTGASKPGERRPFADVAVAYLFKTEGGNILFLGDTLYQNAYVLLGQKYDIDLAIFNIGNNAPGALDKPTPYDAYMIMEALKADYFIPFHWESWSNVASDPGEVEWIFAKRNPRIRPIILQPGAAIVFPRDKDIGRYIYPDSRENYRPECSWEYGGPARAAGAFE